MTSIIGFVTTLIRGATSVNCEKCQQLLSEFVDMTLNDADCVAVSDHLLMCAACYNVHLELSLILARCHEIKIRDDVGNEPANPTFNYGQI